jgi:hypothetical protein
MDPESKALLLRDELHDCTFAYGESCVQLVPPRFTPIETLAGSRE